MRVGIEAFDGLEAPVLLDQRQQHFDVGRRRAGSDCPIVFGHRFVCLAELLIRKPQRDERAAAFAIGDAQPAPVGFDDFAAQREAEAGARLPWWSRTAPARSRARPAVNPGPAIAHFDGEALRRRAHRELDVAGVGAGLARVLEQVDQRLLDLRGVEARGALRQVGPRA